MSNIERLRPRKRLGQNFLQDPNTIRKIVDAVHAEPGDLVLEIGPGMGALTGLLRDRFERFVALEVDPRAVTYLNDQLPGVEVREGDILTLDWKALAAEAPSGRLVVVGNLPYYLTTPILIGLLDNRTVIRDAVIMMQLEVAERLVAQRRTKEYGILSVYMRLLARTEILFQVSRNVFFPKPDVTSAVVRVSFDDATGLPDGVDEKHFRDVIRTAFNQRRKTLHNSLGRWTREGGFELPEGWGKRRAEDLDPAEFVTLARHLAPVT